jgi:copper chaperone NosL
MCFTFARFACLSRAVPARAVPCLLLAALLLAACAPKSNEPQPPEILYGQDLCDACGMIIDEARFAAATILLDGQALKFDDIGEMVIYHLDHPEAQVKAWFVHDYDSEAWIRGETAHFVKGDLKTPMGGSIAAFETQAAAEAFAAAVNGKLFTLDELRVELHLTVHGG